jgi:hypothetical protein
MAVTVVAQLAKAPGIHCYVAGSIPAVTPRYCTKKIEKCSLEHKKTKEKKLMAVVGRLQETVAIWRPVTWLNTTRAFRPLARQRSYSAVKSAIVTAGVGPVGPSTLARAPPLTTLSHMAVGETREVGGRGEVFL